MTNVTSLFKVTGRGRSKALGLNEERMNGAAVLYTPRLDLQRATASGGREFVLERTKTWRLPFGK